MLVGTAVRQHSALGHSSLETMTKKDYKKIPPPELIQKWCKAARGDHLEIIIKAAEWGYRQRCLEELSDLGQELQVSGVS